MKRIGRTEAMARGEEPWGQDQGAGSGSVGLDLQQAFLQSWVCAKFHSLVSTYCSQASIAQERNNPVVSMSHRHLWEKPKGDTDHPHASSSF